MKVSDDNCYYEINICLDWTGVRPCTLHTTVPRTKARCSVEREIHGRFGVYRVCIPKDPHAPVRGNTVSAGGYSYSKEAVSQRLGARRGARQMRSAFTGCLGAVAHKLASVSIVPPGL